MLAALLWLSPFVALGVIVWLYRRKTAEREAASNARLKEFLSQTPLKGAADAAPTATGASPAPAVTPAVAAAAAPSPVSFAVRERMLPPPQTLLYYLLKANLSDYEVLTQVSMAAVMDVPAAIGGFERETRQRRLAAAVVDFVVCDKSFKPVAVVQCGARDGSAADGLAFARACCESAALRWVEVVPTALPKREVIRLIVLGA